MAGRALTLVRRTLSGCAVTMLIIGVGVALFRMVVIDPELDHVLDGWRRCARQIPLQCRGLDVPADPGAPDGPTLRLALLKRPADAATPKGTLLFHPGGPSPIVTDLCKRGFGNHLPRDVLEHYDVVTWDIRGLGRSTPALRCPDAEAILSQGDHVAGFEDALDAGAEIAVALRRCAQEQPALHHVSLVDMAHDVEAIRVALGDEKISVAMWSFAAGVGFAYAGLFPDRIDRLVLGLPPPYPGLDTPGADLPALPPGRLSTSPQPQPPPASAVTEPHPGGPRPRAGAPTQPAPSSVSSAAPATRQPTREQARAALGRLTDAVGQRHPTKEELERMSVLLRRIGDNSSLLLAAFYDLSAECMRGDACPLGDEPIHVMKALIRRLARAPVAATGGRQLDRAMFVLAAQASVNRESVDRRRFLTAMADLHYDGDATGLVSIYDRFALHAVDGTGLYSWLITCEGEARPPPDRAAWRPSSGSVRMCDPAQIIDEHPAPVPGVTNALVVAGEWDTGTPLLGARRAAAALGAPLVIVQEGTHQVSGTCAAEAVRRFLVEDEPPDRGSRYCVTPRAATE